MKQEKQQKAKYAISNFLNKDAELEYNNTKIHSSSLVNVK